MKCKYCNGTGTIKSIFGEDCVCPECVGYGEVVEPTNFEFMQDCTMEEMAEWFSKHLDPCDSGCYHCMIRKYCHADGCTREIKEYWLDWLKEKHNG